MDLRIALAGNPNSGKTTLFNALTRGGGDTRFLMVADVLFLWAVSVPAGALAGLVLHTPEWVAMICLKLDLIIKSVWCVSRLNSGKWIHIVEEKHA